MSDAGGKPLKGLASVPGPDVFREEFHESLSEVLNIDSWRAGRDPAREYERIYREVKEATNAEDQLGRSIREQVLPRIAEMDIPESGHYQATPEEIVQTLFGLLLNGGVQACDGTNDVHDTLTLIGYHLGVALVSYRGEEACLQTQMFRRDMRLARKPTLADTLEWLARRKKRAGLHPAAAAGDELSELARRGVTSFMERYVLVHRSTSPWIMGHGSPAPLELVGTGFTDLVIRSIRLVRELVAHGKFIFVASEQSTRGEATIGQALYPTEYVVTSTLDMHLHNALENWHPRHDATEDLCWENGKESISPREWMARFREEVCPKIVCGVYRATSLAKPHMFFAHRDHVHTAARIAIADSRFNEQRGFPMLIDLADRVCRTVYGGKSFSEMQDTAYAQVGAPFRYHSERATRDH